MQVWRAFGTLTILGGTLTHQGYADALSNDSSNLAHGRRDSVARRSISCRKAFSWDNKRSRVWAGVEQKLANDVQGKQGSPRQAFVCESENAEEDGEEKEANHLEWLATEGVDSKDGSPIARQRACTGQDDHSHCLVVKFFVKRIACAIADCLKNHGVVEAKAIECEILG